MSARFRLSLLAALALAAPADTHAGALECESRAIGGSDARKMASVARKAAGSLKLVKSSLSACMNPGSGRAWYDAQPVMLPDWSILRPHVICTRENGPWTCEVRKERVARIEVVRNGSKQLHEFELPLWLEVDDAHRLVSLAFELGPTLTKSQYCSRAAGPTNSADDREKAFSRASFDATTVPGRKRIVEEPDGVGVIINGNYMKFVLSPDHNAWRFVCLGDWIEVS